MSAASSRHKHSRTQFFLIKLITKLTMAMIANKKKRIFAISTAPAAMPPKPKIAAIRAITKNTTE